MTVLPTAPFSVAGARITGTNGVRSFVPVGANIGVNARVGGTQYPFDEARNPHVVEAAAWGWNTVRLTVSVSEEVSWVNSYGAENAHADIYAAVDNYVGAGFVVVLALMDVTAGNQSRTDGKDADMFAFLSEAAARYVGEPRVWFNVNEPAGVATAEAFQAFHGQMYSAVRNVGNQSIYVADVMTNAQDGTWRTAPIAHDPTVGPAFLQGRTNVVFGLHNYGGQAQNNFTQGMVDAKYLAYIDACQAAGMCVQIFEAGYRVDGLDQAGGTADVNRNVRGFRASLNLPKDRRVGVVVWNGTFDLFGLKNTLKSTYHTQPFWFEGPDGDLSPMGQEFWQYSHLPPLEEHVAQNVNVVQGGLASGTGTTVNLAAPARKAGDIVQFVSQSQYPATPQTTTGYTKVIEQGGFTVWQQDTTVDTPAGNARLNFAGSGTYSAFFQVINATAVVSPNPETPTGFVTKSGTQLRLGGQPFKFVGNNGINLFGPTGPPRTISDYTDYFNNKVPGTVDRVWFMPGEPVANLDRALAAAKATGGKLIVTLFDALGSKAPNWSTMKANWSTYSSHVTNTVTRYKDETSIAFWEIANEPPQDRAGFDLVGKAIKDADPNHLVSTGTVPAYSSGALVDYENAGASPYVDILSIHEYDTQTAGVTSHLARHLPVAQRLGKPIFVGEFGIDANSTGSGTGNTGNNGVVTYARRAQLIGIKTDAYLNTPEVCGACYWSVGQGDINVTNGDTYMAYSETVGMNALKAAIAKWNTFS